MMDELERKIREHAQLRIARLFKVLPESLTVHTAFAKDLQASFVSYFRNNEFDQIDNDIKDVADRNIRHELASGALVIQTVGDYCDHMVRCYHLNPEEVVRVLRLEEDGTQ